MWGLSLCFFCFFRSDLHKILEAKLWLHTLLYASCVVVKKSMTQ